MDAAIHTLFYLCLNIKGCTSRGWGEIGVDIESAHESSKIVTRSCDLSLR